MAKINVRDRNKGTGKKPNWEYRFEMATVGGKRQNATRSGFRTKKEAEEAGAKAFAEYCGSGVHFTPSTISVSDYFDYWLENYGRNHYKDTTFQTKVYVIEKNIKPSLGKYRLSSITPLILQEFINGFRNKSKSYIIIILATIHIAFRCAVFPFELIQTDPSVYVTPPVSTTLPIAKEKVTINAEEFKRIITKFPFGTTYYIPFMLGWHCGLRISETVGLTWNSVDFNQKKVIINMQVNQFANKGDTNRKISTPKYGSSRAILIDDEMLWALQRERNRQTFLRENMGTDYPTYSYDCNMFIISGGDTMDFVCRNKYGEWLSIRSLNHAVEAVKSMLGKNISYHTFRHSHATMLLECGINPKVIQQRLGHRKMSTTLDVYTHATPEAEAEAIEKIQHFFKEVNNDSK